MKQSSVYLILQASALLLWPMLAEAYNRQRLLCLLNDSRVKAGLKPLKEDSVLNSTADQVSSTQAKSKAKTPPPTDAALLSEVNLNGYRPWIVVKQAVIQGARNEEECVKQWMASPQLRAPLLDPTVTRWGGSVVYNEGVAYWTSMVGNDGDPTQDDVTACPVGEDIVVEGEPGTGTSTTPAPKPADPSDLTAALATPPPATNATKAVASAGADQKPVAMVDLGTIDADTMEERVRNTADDASE
ncbi:hypothetical protein SYNPS1DRAFT_21291 [Syncephalis pseudoplumigaleata]|uniref:SCP domain-containing protein n=1 Tax=Syncephalis pseudoplumigaleata TaxID=1712513 RepID=A0A4P9Z629_9FUNG|nr:hypothetical protein SYNPS1DRAFT_21291 [Syncephalis pseudoplumigaleata]|eukprot:RKP27100.1 hypothetical protein SYNPS1DRAFT_21291 [Syncephalis pseudoplumigaleata]